MAKHPTSSRVHREADGHDDAFVSGVKQFVQWMREHDRQLTIAGVVLGVLAVLAVYYVNSQRRVEAEAAARFAQVQQSVASGNPELAVRDLQGYLETFGGAEAARPARLLLADVLIGQKQPAEAVTALDGLPDDLDEPYGIAAARLLAAAREQMGEADQAVSTYRRIADRARFPYQKREALADAARVRLQNGDADGAASLYAQVLDTFGEQEGGRGYYEMWLAEARAEAARGGAAAPTTADTAADTTAAGHEPPAEGGEAD